MKVRAPKSKLVALTAISVLAVAGLGGPASAESDGDVEVLNTETVQVYLDAAGEVQSQRVYEQLELRGSGKVELRNPVSTDGLRNLDGFSGFELDGKEQLVTATVDGEKQLRSVSSFDGKLPLDLQVKYTLDGKPVEPGDVVGKSGSLEVRFIVENVTGRSQELTYADGKGEQVSSSASVPVPMVGSLTTVAPPSFDNVASKEANVAGDGKGGMKLSFTMTLFPPIGSTTAEFGYTADINDGVVPRVDISVLPVNPLESPSFKSAASSYQGGADTGSELTAGATEIDGNLLKLRDGAADLLAGLIQLNDGAGRLADGTTELDEGAGQLADGSKKLKDGAGDAADGGRALTDGLKKIDGGLDQLADVKAGLPAAKGGIKQLRDGIAVILAGFGDPSDPTSLIGGLKALGDGLGTAEKGAGDLRDGLQVLTGNVPAESPGLKGARAGADEVKTGLDSALGPANGAGIPGGELAELALGLEAVKTNFCATHPATAQCNGVLDQLIQGVGGSRNSLTRASVGVGQVSAGLGNAISALEGLLIPGSRQLATGVGTARGGAGDLQTGAVKAKGGVTQVGDGLRTLAGGISGAVSGVLQLSNGAGTAYAGSSDLKDGLAQLADGTVELNDGAGELAAGTSKLRDGAGQLSEGTGQAVEGAPQLRDGAQRLSDEGTKKLVEAGDGTTQSYGEMVAVLNAGAERAQVDNMAYGAPEDAMGLTAYTYIIQGEDGEGGRNMTRGLAGLVLLGAGAAVFGLRRRFA